MKWSPIWCSLLRSREIKNFVVLLPQLIFYYHFLFFASLNSVGCTWFLSKSFNFYFLSFAWKHLQNIFHSVCFKMRWLKLSAMNELLVSSFNLSLYFLLLRLLPTHVSSSTMPFIGHFNLSVKTQQQRKFAFLFSLVLIGPRLFSISEKAILHSWAA